MYNWNLFQNFMFSLEDKNGKLVPYSEWSNFKNENFAQYTILVELKENDLATTDYYYLHVDVGNILELSELDKNILNLPDHYPYEILVSSVGQLNQDDFRFQYLFFDFIPNGNVLTNTRKGPIIRAYNTDYLLDINQYRLCEAIDEFNSLDSSNKSFNKNLLNFAGIKELSKKSTIILDKYLSEQKISTSEKIKIDLKYENSELLLIPKIPQANDESFLRQFEIFPKVKEVYNLKDSEGNTIRFVPNEKQIAELIKIKEKKKIVNQDEINSIIEHPELAFNDEVIDLSIFYSDRVRDIGLYKPKYYPFICPYKSEWIPGFVIKDRIDGEKRIIIKTNDELEILNKSIQNASNQNNNTVYYKEVEIPISEAKHIAKIAALQLSDTKIALDKLNNNIAKNVLIIKENAEVLEYELESNSKNFLKHNFYEISNLTNYIKLKSHQVEGIAWLQSLSQQYSGCLLADDMGLGKTLQVLYFIEWHAQVINNLKPYLIVAPISLLENWENEYNKFFSYKYLKLVNLNKTEIEINQNFDSNSISLLNKKQILLTNYETLKKFQLNLCAIDYAVVILDEAQKVKTPGTIVTNTVKALKADFRIAVTGTPVENSLVDIWCIMDFALPGLLGNAKDFSKTYQNPLKHSNSDVISITNNLRNRIGIFLKRRMKEDVLKELPIKHDDENCKIKLEMPIKQLERYIYELNKLKNHSYDENDRSSILSILWRLRDISDHPFLLDYNVLEYDNNDLINNSAKLQISISILDKIKAKNEKVIIFADRKITQKLLQKVIFGKYSILPSIINGDTSSMCTKKSSKLSRQQTIDNFQNTKGFNVIIMSQLAAGIGLNVTRANHVIHFSRHWNPAKENQATDRVFRIGQEKEVYIYYPMAVSSKFETFDIVLDKLLEKKKKLATNTLFPTEQAEINSSELIKSVLDSVCEVDNKFIKSALQLDEMMKLTNIQFLNYIVYGLKLKQFSVEQFCESNNKGVDIAIFSKDFNAIAKVKKNVNNRCKNYFNELIAVSSYFEEKYKTRFKKVVITLDKIDENLHNTVSEDLLIWDQVFILGLQKEFNITILEMA